MEYNEILNKLLDRLKEAGYTHAAFSCYDPDIPTAALQGIYVCQSMHYDKSYLYVYPNMKDAVWRIVDDLKVGACGGSTSCHGLKRDFAEYVGAYSYRLVKGKWIKLSRKYDDQILMGIINKIRYISDTVHTHTLGLLSDDYDVIEIAKQKNIYDVLTCPVDELPLYINDRTKGAIACICYRLKKGI